VDRIPSVCKAVNSSRIGGKINRKGCFCRFLARIAFKIQEIWILNPKKKMIRYDEIMIGDYVLVNGTPRKVEAVTKKKIGYHIHPQTDNRMYYARLHEIEPITAELVDFIEIENIFGKITITTADAILRNDVKYGGCVHRLQNILRVNEGGELKFKCKL
jgi:hypothetical protein